MTTAEFLLSLLLGIACSLIAWWIVFRVLTPSLKFSSGISKNQYNTHEGSYSYRIKFMNVGHRDIIDIKVKSYLKIRSLIQGSGVITNVEILSSKSEIPMLANNKGFIIKLLPDQTSNFSKPSYPSTIVKKYSDGNLNIEDVLAIGEDAWIQLIAFGFDSFSGSRQVFCSPEYRLHNIKPGKFKELEIYEIGSYE